MADEKKPEISEAEELFWKRDLMVTDIKKKEQEIRGINKRLNEIYEAKK